ncbi:MAG: C25 family cysteine peptidase, partial [Anaerolineae bacterium]|nr:C25 family cysteine peptidase [Anaerolineae bacterium]
GAVAPWPTAGTQIRTTTTDSTGWYGLVVYDDDVGPYDFLYIEETDPVEYQSVGATSVDGTVQSSNHIEYALPLNGQTTSGNKFWDEIPVLSGRVYEGSVGDESTPFPGVQMELYASNNQGVQGSLIVTTTTDTSGWYGLPAPLGYEYYTIKEVNPSGYDSVDATSVDGTRLDADRIRYAHPLAGQVLTDNKFWDVPTLGDLPDLVITEVWDQGGELCYQVANIGTAATPSGHETELLIDSGWPETLVVPVGLNPGETFEDCFTVAWSCSIPEDGIEVVADAGLAVDESQEDNNTWTDTWPCDSAPPEITAGPIAVDITAASARIYWETSEPATSDVFFGTYARSLPGEKLDASLMLAHEVVIDGLSPYTTYRFQVHSADASGNATESGHHSFRTLAESDGTGPAVELHDPGSITGTVTITATATDNSGVDRVQFLIDDVVVFTDYSSPYEYILDPQIYDFDNHNLKARAFDYAGNELTNGHTVDFGKLVDQSAPTVNITSPAHSAILSGKVNVNATLSDDLGLAQIFFKIVQGTSIWTEGFEGLPANPTSYNASFEWDTTQVANGNYRVAIETYDMEGKYGYDFRDITVDQAAALKPAKLKVVGHAAVRTGNGFVISLAVKNVGEETASNVAIEDTLKAFQPVSRTTFTAPAAIYTTEYDAYTQAAEMQIEALTSIPGGQTVTYSYAAAPVLFYPTSPVPAIGDYIYLHWDPPAGSRLHDIVTVPVVKTQDGDTLATAHAKAVKAADYIIMTNPTRLFMFGYPDIAGVYNVLSEMAQLAIYQEGVLGYLNSYDRGKIDQLLVPTGAWGKLMAPQFSTALGGYLLIVGEREIVPTTLWSHFNLTWSNSSCNTTQVQDSDLSYANTVGNAAPELIVGRAIGNDPADLYNVLHTSNAVFANESGYGFDRSHALLVSGTDGNTKIQNSFTGFINDTDKLITSDYAVTKIHWSNYTSVTVGLNAFVSAAPNKDLVVYQGHGSPDGWGSYGTALFDGINAPFMTLPAMDFGSANPLVIGLACLTGAYEDHTANTCSYDGGDSNIAEAFLDKGAGVYIGSTEVSPIGNNVQGGKEFFKTYWSAYETPIGKALTALKRAHATSSSQYWRFWVFEYNLYGDPKYGALPSPMAGASAVCQPDVLPSPTINITVPDYVVTTLDGIDYVEIPGGSLLMEAGMPEVPSYISMVDYPAGTQIQDVALTARNGLTTAFGLNVPTHENWFAAPVNVPIVQAYRSAESTWYPGTDFDWTVIDNPDGSTTLVLTVYPFAYNGATTESRFYTDYTFAVDYAETPAWITELSVDKDEVNYGETLNATLLISTTQPIGNASVGCVIEEGGTGEEVVELLMDTLTELDGLASYTLSWLADHVPQENYRVACELRDGGGILLDRQMAMFTLGTVRAVVHDFTVGPATFSPSGVVTASLQVHNSGTVDLNGTLVVDIRDSRGAWVDTLSEIFTGLAPANTITFDTEWHTPHRAAGTYVLTGYALYNSQVTDPETLSVRAWSRVYVPVVVRQ